MNEQLSAIGPAMANHLWQTTAFVAVVWVMTLVLRKNQARVRYALWLAASLKFLLPFSLLIALGGILPRPQQAAAAPGIYATVDAVAQPFSEFDSTPIPATPVPTLMKRIEASVPMTLAAIWLCGVVILLALWGARWLQVWRTLRHATRAESGREFDLLQRVAPGVGLRGGVTLRLSSELMEPGIFGMGIGIFRPVLIWPERLSEHLDDEHIEAILLHELMHVRRRDNLTAALHMLVTALFWFHPLVWWMERRMIEERERACDEAVVALGSAPGIYAESLLKACRFCIESPLTCVAGITGADLRDRVVQIMTERSLRRLTIGKKLGLVVAGLLVVAVPIVLGQVKAMRCLGMDVLLSSGHETFEVATVRQVPDDRVAHLRPFPDRLGDRFTWTMSLGAMMAYAYHIPDWRIEGIHDNHLYTIAATMNPSASDDQVRQMLQTLLQERFKIVSHIQTKETQGYAIVVAKNGPKLKTANLPADEPPLPDFLQGAPATHWEGHIVTMFPGPGVIGISGRGVSTSDLARETSADLQAPVVDQTGLMGRYYFGFKFQSIEHPGEGADAPSIFTALPDELGLKLEKQKVATEFLVVDHFDKPSIDGSEPMAAPAKITQPDVIMSAEKPSVDGAEVQAPSETPIQNPVPALVAAQSSAPAPPLAFDVATIKPSNPNTRYSNMNLSADGIEFSNLSLTFVLQFAYNLNAGSTDQIVDAPSWVSTTPFDINAKMNGKTAAAIDKLTPDQRASAFRRMVQMLLAERFQLKLHHETREMPVLALVIAKGGSKLTAASDSPPVDPSKPHGPDDWTGLHNQRGTTEGRDEPVKLLVDALSSRPEIGGRLVVDETGLRGNYNFKLQWAPEDGRAGSNGTGQSGPSLFTALQEQLGLKLVSSKAPVDVLVIDHVERPSAN